MFSHNQDSDFSLMCWKKTGNVFFRTRQRIPNQIDNRNHPLPVQLQQWTTHYKPLIPTLFYLLVLVSLWFLLPWNVKYKLGVPWSQECYNWALLAFELVFDSFGYSQMLIRLYPKWRCKYYCLHFVYSQMLYDYTVSLDTVELTSSCIQKCKYFDFELKHKLKLNRKQTLNKHTLLGGVESRLLTLNVCPRFSLLFIFGSSFRNCILYRFSGISFMVKLPQLMTFYYSNNVGRHCTVTWWNPSTSYVTSRSYRSGSWQGR